MNTRPEGAEGKKQSGELFFYPKARVCPFFNGGERRRQKNGNKPSDRSVVAAPKGKAYAARTSPSGPTLPLKREVCFLVSSDKIKSSFAYTAIPFPKTEMRGHYFLALYTSFG